MRNKFAGKCYRCGSIVAPGDGHFEKYRNGWRTQHATCAIEFRGQRDEAGAAWDQERLERRAQGTGRSAQRARRRLREQQSGIVDYEERA